LFSPAGSVAVTLVAVTAVSVSGLTTLSIETVVVLPVPVRLVPAMVREVSAAFGTTEVISGVAGSGGVGAAIATVAKLNKTALQIKLMSRDMRPPAVLETFGRMFRLRGGSHSAHSACMQQRKRHLVGVASGVDTWAEKRRMRKQRDAHTSSP